MKSSIIEKLHYGYNVKFRKEIENLIIHATLLGYKIREIKGYNEFGLNFRKNNKLMFQIRWYLNEKNDTFEEILVEDFSLKSASGFKKFYSIELVYSEENPKEEHLNLAINKLISIL